MKEYDWEWVRTLWTIQDLLRDLQYALSMKKQKDAASLRFSTVPILLLARN